MRKNVSRYLNASMNKIYGNYRGTRDKLSTELIKFNFLDF